MSLQTVNVNLEAQSATKYPIFIGENILHHLGDYVQKFTKARKLMIVTNTTVYSIYSDTIKKSLEDAGLQYEFVILEDGEQFKSIQSLQVIWDKTLKYKLERKDVFVALGGGVIGDITGFAASTYLRGIDFIQVPTTLLAQVDSSVGGKVAINHSAGKNLIGAFYQPKFVLADINTLKTLPIKELKTGLAEVIKYGFIENTCGYSEDFKFLNFLKDNIEQVYQLDSDTIIKTVEICCRLKAAVVNQDEKEVGLRAILNFGHTIAHALEKCTAYKVFTHGEAVAIGMKGAFYLAKEQELCDASYIEDSIALIDRFGLDYKIPNDISAQSLVDAMMSDKKVVSNKKHFILPTDLAKVGIFDNIEDYNIIAALKKLY